MKKHFVTWPVDPLGVAGFGLALLLPLAAWPRQAGRAAMAPVVAPVAPVVAGEYLRAHDPSRIVRCNGKYFVYTTGDKVAMRYSSDLVTWHKGPSVLESIPEWARRAVPGAKGDYVWAPDVIFVGGKYLLFWSFSTFGSRVSVTGLATSPTLDPESPDYKWTDQGPVLATKDSSDFNAIDASPILDERGDLWLAIGSWQRGGIKIVKLDKASGKPAANTGADALLPSIAARQSSGPEAAYLHFRGGWYYLFENEGRCCAGMDSTYNIRVGRSKAIGGPYLDRDGRDLARGGGSLFLGSEGEMIGPGHVGIYEEGGVDHLTFHFYNSRANGAPTLAVQSLSWGEGGWPRAVPELPGGRYAIVSVASGLALGVANNKADDGNPIDQFEYRGGPTQQWNISPAGDGSYAIASVGTGKYLQAAACSDKDGASIVQQPWQRNGCQKWRIEPLSSSAGPDVSYRITSQTTSRAGSALTMPGGAKQPQALAQSWAWSGQSGQQWVLKKLP